jgi:hypothetical protein
MSVPARHWRSYGNDTLPTPQEAMLEPMRAFPSWFLRIECDRCGKTVMHNEAHLSERQRRMVLRVLLSRMRHDGCGGRPARAELLTGIEGCRCGRCGASCCWVADSQQPMRHHNPGEGPIRLGRPT